MYTKGIKIPIEDLEQLKLLLPHGGIKKIADKLIKDRQHVEKVLKGSYEDQDVLDAAYAIIDEAVDSVMENQNNISERIVKVSSLKNITTA